MNWFKHDAQLSQAGDIAGVERYFGLPGYARLLKLYEAASMSQGKLVLKWSELEALLSGKQKTLEEFLQYLDKAGFILLSMMDSQINIEVITLPESADTVDPSTLSPYFHNPEQWRIWLRLELCYTDRQINQPGNDGILKQWIAGHITVDEVGESIDQAVIRSLDIKQLANLHKLVVESRRQKLEEARQSC